MKITKAKLKQLIQEELSSLSEARRRNNPFSIQSAAQLMPRASHHAAASDPGGTSMLYNPDVEGMPPEEQADPVVAAIAKVEDLRGLVEVGDEGALTAIDELWDHLQSMLTVPSNEVPLSRQ